MKQGRKDLMKPKMPSNKAIDRKSNKQIKEFSPFEYNSDLQNLSVEELRISAKEMKKILSEKQSQVLNADKMYRIQNFKNQNYKFNVLEVQKNCEKLRINYTKRLIELYKQHKESPLFFNQNGLSPYELMLLNYSKNDQHSENICMVCFLDISPNSHIVILPCSHILHKQCGMQHLLYSKQCPGCSLEINLTDAKKQ